MAGYQSVKKWRNSNPKRKQYNTKFMEFKRRHYKTLFESGQVKLEAIPKSYRSAGMK